MKQYSKCKELYKEDQFYKDRSQKDGLQNWCKNCSSKNHSKHYKENTEDRLEYGYRWNQNHVASRAQYYQNHIKNHRAQMIEWRRNNSLKCRIYSHKRRAKLSGSGGSHTDQDIIQLYAEQEGKCKYCNCSIEDYYEVDHIVPVSKGGTDNPDNLTLACKKCNRSKFNKTVEEWSKFK